MDTTKKTAVIFDIDGTLVESSRFEDDVYISAIRDVLGNVNIRSDERIAIMQKCLHALGNSFQRIVYAGDAEWDVRATRELGWHFIGVGPRLKGKCEYWVEDLSNHEAFVEMLHA